MMKVKYRTLTYGTVKDGEMRLMLEVSKKKFRKDTVEVEAVVDLETGEVKFQLAENNLEKLKKCTE